MVEDNKPEEKSKYNEASLQVLRLHELELRIEAVLHNSDTLNKEIEKRIKEVETMNDKSNWTKEMEAREAFLNKEIDDLLEVRRAFELS